MRKGFIFNFNLCVNCKACSAACILENKWTATARNIYIFNSEILPSIPVTNLSLACNHCEEPICMHGCPTGAYSRDETSSAVIIDSEKCIGCRYCKWNCPYDAPKLNVNKGTIEKCNFCYQRINEEVEPACTAACPTGALKFGEIPESPSVTNLKWVPDKNINPALMINGRERAPLMVFPEPKPAQDEAEPLSMEKNLKEEWSLIFFTFLTIVSVSLNIGLFMGDISSGTILPIAILTIASVFSLFHLRKKLYAWKAIINAKKSPLSREIILFAVYSLVNIASILTNVTGLLLITVVSGFILLMAIDSVYTYADRSVRMQLHSGQAFLTGLLIGSYMAGAIVPFLFVASVKIIFNTYCLIKLKPGRIYHTLRIIRVAFLFIISGSVIAGIEGMDTIKYIILLSGEFADRVIYYIEFEPVNINSEILKNLNTSI